MLNRRRFLQRLVGAAAVATVAAPKLLLPEHEEFKRYWPGWSAPFNPTKSACRIVLPDEGFDFNDYWWQWAQSDLPGYTVLNEGDTLIIDWKIAV